MTFPYDDLSQQFKVLAHPTRLHILDLLRGGEVCVCHIEAALGKRQAYISQQLMALREAGLVESRKDGLKVYYRLTDPRIADLLAAVIGPAPHVVSIVGCPCPACDESQPAAPIREGEFHAYD